MLTLFELDWQVNPRPHHCNPHGKKLHRCRPRIIPTGRMQSKRIHHEAQLGEVSVRPILNYYCHRRMQTDYNFQFPYSLSVTSKLTFSGVYSPNILATM